MRRLRIVIGLTVIGALCLGGWRWNHGRLLVARAAALRSSSGHPGGAAKADHVPTAAVQRMDLHTILLATGTLEPAESHYVTAPIGGNMRVERVVPDGSVVRAGEVVVQLAIRDVDERLGQTRDGLQQAREALERAHSESGRRIDGAKAAAAVAQQRLELARSQNAADADKAQAELDQANGEMQYADGQLAKMQRLADQGLATREQLDQTRKERDERAFSCEKAQRALANTRREADEKMRSVTMAADRAQLDLADAETGSQRAIESARNTIQGLERQVTDFERQVREATVRSSTDGMVLFSPRFWDQSGLHSLRVGDQVWGGMNLGQVIDPKRLRVSCEIDEIDMRRVRAGNRVRLRVGTARGRVFQGRLERVDNIATEGQFWRGGSPGRRSFAAWVTVERGDRALRPGTTAWLEIEVEAASGKLVVPLQALFPQGGSTVVFRANGDRFDAVKVRLGPRNELSCTVLGGLNLRDRVATQRPPADLLRSPRRAQGAG